eukprot:8283439-Prorocentrum_lima.AAC.1
MAEERGSSIQVRKTLSKKTETLRSRTKGTGRDSDEDEDDRMEVPSPRTGQRRIPQMRERGASTPTASSKGSIPRRGGPPAGEVRDLMRQ